MDFGQKKRTLNSIVEKADEKTNRHSSKKAERELEKVQRKLENKSPGDRGFDRLMRRAERLENCIDD